MKESAPTEGNLPVKGYLMVHVKEATGRNNDSQFTWDHNNFEGWLRVEIKGGPKPVKAHTTKKKVTGTNIIWNEYLILTVLEGSKELRMLVCREKPQKGGRQVVAACGIYINEILDAFPIDKYFELYRPGAEGGDGGFIRVELNYNSSREVLMKEANLVERYTDVGNPGNVLGALKEEPDEKTRGLADGIITDQPKQKKKGGFFGKLLKTGLVVGVGAAAFTIVKAKRAAD